MRWFFPLLLMATAVEADMTVIDDFAAPNGWSYVSDRVMGGVSDGGGAYDVIEGEPVLRLQGEVSTANNGGFIQVRRVVPVGFPNDTDGLTLKLIGNGARYYIHLRTTSSRAPWQYYAASFATTGAWQEVSLDWRDFQPNGRGLADDLSPQDVRSIGIVAYGADYTAELAVSQIALR